MGQFMKDLKQQQPELHDLLAAGLQKLRNRANHRAPLTEKVDQNNDIYELRVGGRNIARAFFFFRRGQEIIVTNGYVKKSQKVDLQELRIAQQRKADWERRFP